MRASGRATMSAASGTCFKNVLAHFASGFGLISHFSVFVIIIAHNEIIRIIACFAVIILSCQSQLPLFRSPPLFLFQLARGDFGSALDV
jgi:hypothetical protein